MQADIEWEGIRDVLANALACHGPHAQTWTAAIDQVVAMMSAKGVYSNEVKKLTTLRVAAHWLDTYIDNDTFGGPYPEAATEYHYGLRYDPRRLHREVQWHAIKAMLLRVIHDHHHVPASTWSEAVDKSVKELMTLRAAAQMLDAHHDLLTFEAGEEAAATAFQFRY